LNELNEPSSISHPIDAYHLIKRLTINWDQVKEALLRESNITDKIRNEMMTISKSFPTSDDLSGAAFSLAQLQGAYHLNVSQLASGFFTFKHQIFSSNRPLNS
jgi:prolyl 4-hydroxylase